MPPRRTRAHRDGRKHHHALPSVQSVETATLLNSDKAYAFVTDEVDGYLFVDAQSGGPVSDVEIEMGIILVGLTAVSDFEFTNLWTSL